MNFISIALPVYNGDNYLEEAIDSIEDQDYSHYELVILDNHSTDRTSEILKARSAANPRIRVIRNPATVSQVENVNLSVLNCKGEWIQLFCHDDIMLPGCLSSLDKAISAVSNDPGITLIGHGAAWLFSNDVVHLPGTLVDGSEYFSRTRLSDASVVRKFDTSRVKIYRHGVGSKQELKEKIQLYLPALTTAVVRRDAFIQNGMFDHRYVHFDVFAWMKMLMEKDYLLLDIPLTLTRIHGMQVAVDARKTQRTIRDNVDFWKEYAGMIRKKQKLGLQSELMLYLKPMSTISGLISVELVKGDIKGAWRIFSNQDILSMPVIALLVLRSYPREKRRIEKLAEVVPLPLIYP
jgi:glycosyltransferase involved in cell wall biosynthesis